MSSFKSGSALSNSLKGNGFWILNVLRAGNIIALLAVIAASGVMLAFPIMNKKFFFFDFMSHLIIMAFAAFVGVSETGLFKKYFARNWPILSEERHGFFWLGNMLIALGFLTLANLNEDALLPSNIPKPVWSLIMASGILSLTFGVFAWISSLIFSDRNARVSARTVRKAGSLAEPSKDDYPSSMYSGGPTTYSSPTYAEKEETRANKWAGRARRFTSQFGPSRRPNISRPVIDPDFEDTRPVPVTGYDDGTKGGEAADFDFEAQNHSPLQPPPTAAHPANRGRQSGYSEASHLPRHDQHIF